MSKSSHSVGMLDSPVNHRDRLDALPSAAGATVFMLLGATTHWQALPQPERDELLDDVFVRVFNAFPGVRLRQYDSDAFDRRVGAVLVWEAEDLAEYRDAVALLREHPLLTRPYFHVVDTIMAAEHLGTAGCTLGV